MKPRSLSTLPGALTAVVVGVLVAVLLTSPSSLASPAVAAPVAVPVAAPVVVPVAAPVAQAPDPGQDYPRMPTSCASATQKIPIDPVVCALNGYVEDRPSVLLWGDSHAWMFIPALQAAAEGRDVNLVAVLMGSCPPMDNAVRPDAEVAPCFRSNALGVRTVRRLADSGQPYRVILSSSWERYVHARAIGDRRSYIGRMAEAMRAGTPRLAKTLAKLGADVDVVGQVPTVPTRRAACAAGDEPYACPLARAQALPDAATTTRWVAKNLRPVLGSRPPIDVTPAMCTATACNGVVGSTFTWFDDLHLSASMSTELASYLGPSVDAVAPAPPPTTPADTACTIPIICP